jgi:hypothetical protein
LSQKLQRRYASYKGFNYLAVATVSVDYDWLQHSDQTRCHGLKNSQLYIIICKIVWSKYDKDWVTHARIMNETIPSETVETPDSSRRYASFGPL